MDFLPIFLSVILFFHLFYILALIKNDFSIIDIAWGLGHLLVWISCFYFVGVPFHRTILLGGLVFLWAFRLAIYIFIRNKKTGEDFRYAEMRKEWKNEKVSAYFKVYWLQAILLLISSSPIYFILKTDLGGLSYWDYLGCLVFVFGLIYESVADIQKYKFKINKNNKDKICNVGLWKYSRFPNYFGEMLVWWGVFLMSVTEVDYFMGALGPLFITIALLKISGVPILEKKYRKNPKYLDYAGKTNMLIPWPPKK